jgi:cytidine deaminase
MPVSRKKTVSTQLVKAVKRAIKFSYAPYSEILIGAGLYCASGKIYTGVNIENSSYSLTMCAERVALFKAISEGEKKIILLLLYSPQAHFTTPCGACLQVLNEFAPGIMVATMNKNEEFKFHPLKTLLPKPFRL